MLKIKQQRVCKLAGIRFVSGATTIYRFFQDQKQRCSGHGASWPEFLFNHRVEHCRTQYVYCVVSYSRTF